MNYPETLDWLFHQLPMYQRQGASAYKKDLSNTWLLMEYLGNPHQKIKAIHVAGTNGKGSTSHMLASVLQEQGYKVGLYTSPHLVDFRERIKINGEEISQEYIIDFVTKHKSFFEDNFLSFFEMTVGLAFEYFKDSSVDYVVLETGLGGRLDSTNVVDPLVSVITNIGLDHTQFLGNTLPKIAAEKAGIIKVNRPVVVGEYQEETFPVFNEVAKEKNSKLYKAFELEGLEYDCDLKGVYQKKNIKTALKTLEVLKNLGIEISQLDIQEGLSKVVLNTGLLGRYQIIQENPKVICDTGHNKEGLSLVMSQLEKEEFENLHVVFGVVDDKDLSSVLPMLPKEANYYFVKPAIGRGLLAETLKEAATEYGLKGDSYLSVAVGAQDAIKKAADKDLVFIGGSTFVVADYLTKLKTQKNKTYD